MKAMLNQLGSIPGVVGGVVMTSDGVVVAAMDDSPESEKTAAYLSMVFLGLGLGPSTLGLMPLKRLTVWSARGRIVVIPFDEFALVVLADAVTDIGVALLEVASLARKLLLRSKIQV